FFFFSSRRRHTRSYGDWSSDVCSSDLSVKAAGSALGTGAAIVMDETTCMVRVLERISRFYMAESCGQCTPCREGTGWMNRMLKRSEERRVGKEWRCGWWGDQ